MNVAIKMSQPSTKTDDYSLHVKNMIQNYETSHHTVPPVPISVKSWNSHGDQTNKPGHQCVEHANMHSNTLLSPKISTFQETSRFGTFPIKPIPVCDIPSNCNLLESSSTHSVKPPLKPKPVIIDRNKKNLVVKRASFAIWRKCRNSIRLKDLSPAECTESSKCESGSSDHVTSKHEDVGQVTESAVYHSDSVHQPIGDSSLKVKQFSSEESEQNWESDSDCTPADPVEILDFKKPPRSGRLPPKPAPRKGKAVVSKQGRTHMYKSSRKISSRKKKGSSSSQSGKVTPVPTSNSVEINWKTDPPKDSETRNWKTNSSKDGETRNWETVADPDSSKSNQKDPEVDRQGYEMVENDFTCKPADLPSDNHSQKANDAGGKPPQSLDGRVYCPKVSPQCNLLPLLPRRIPKKQSRKGSWHQLQHSLNVVVPPPSAQRETRETSDYPYIDEAPPPIAPRTISAQPKYINDRMQPMPAVPSRVHGKPAFSALPRSLHNSVDNLNDEVPLDDSVFDGSNSLPATKHDYLKLLEELEVGQEVSVVVVADHRNSSEGSQSLLLDEAPLYQTYHDHTTLRNILQNEFEELDDDSLIYDDVATIQRYGEQFLSRVKKSLREAGHATLEKMLKYEKGTRTLWCETSFVKKSGVLKTLSPKDRKIQEALFEIITSEASYQKSLGIVVDFYMTARDLKALFNNGVLTREDYRKLFSSIDQVKEASQRLLDDFEQIWQDLLQMPITRICDMINTFVHRNIKVYQIYCANLAYQMQTVERLIKVREFCEVLQYLVQDPRSGRLPLQSFLNLPMQRVTRLPLLLDSLCHNLGETHPEYRIALDCLKQTQIFVKSCNDKAQQMQDLEKIHCIDNRLNWNKLKKVPIVSEGRRLLKEGLLQHVTDSCFVRRLTGLKTMVYLFLLSDWLILSRKKRSRYDVLLAKQCSYVEAREIDEDSNPCVFKVKFTDTHEVFVFAAKSETEKIRWMEIMDPHANERIYERTDAPQYQALQGYSSKQTDELSLNQGQIVFVLRKMQDGWFFGYRLPDFQEGWFPADRVIEIRSSAVRSRNQSRTIRLSEYSD